MPISSFHGLRKNSIPTKPWNSTKCSPQKNIPRESPTRRWFFRVPRLWESGFHDVNEEDRDDAKYLKGYHSPVVISTKNSYGNRKTLRKSSMNSRPRGARQESRLKRRDTFPKFAGEISSTRCPTEQIFRRSKTDPSIVPEEKRTRKISNKPPKRPTSLWTVGKKEELSPTKTRRQKINNTRSPPSFYSPDRSLDNSLSKRRPSLGDKVVCILNRKPQLGILKYIGTTHFADGEWCGILLDEACGKNDGSVRGVRYFRCRNKHGIFVHSHKVKCADETTLSKLNLLEGFSSPESSEKREKIAAEGESTMASSDVQFIKESHTVYKHRDVKTLRLTRRNRSVSLDRYLFLKTKQLAKNLNVLIHSADKGDKADTRDLNRINRSVSLPKISKGVVCDSNEICLVSEMAPLEKTQYDKGCNANMEQTADPKRTNTTGVSSDGKSNKFDSASLNIASGQTVVPKVGHAVSLDTHLMIENGQLTVTRNGTNEEFSCQAHAGNKEDPFIQGRHCSCPSLHCADHFSEAITTCLDLGRAERSVIHEGSRENDSSLEPEHAAGIPYNHAVHSHSQSEAMEKLFHKSKVVSGASSNSRDPELGRKGSWPWVTSTPKRSLRSYGSSDNIDTTGTSANEDVFDEGFGSILAQVKLISGNIVEKHSNLERVSGDANIISVNKAKRSMPLEDQAVGVDSNYPDSLSGSQASLSSTGTSGSKGKKKATKKMIPSSSKGSSSKSKSIPSSGIRVPQKQSRLEQIRQQQQNRQGLLSSFVNKSHLANKTGAPAENKSGTKITKRHTLAAITDVKSFVPRPTVNKRPTSAGMTATVGAGSDKEEAQSKLPVKKISMPSQLSRPTALPKVEKTAEKATSVQRRHSAASGRQPVLLPVKRNSSVAQSDSKSRKPSNVTQKSTGKDKESNVVGKKTVGGPAPPSVKGAKEVTATGPKPPTSRVARSSSTAKAKGPPVKETKTQPSAVSTKKSVQPVKQNAKQMPSNHKQGTSKLPRKVSAQLSNASDSVSVTSSVRDQDNLEDLHDSEIDALSVSTETSDHDGRVQSHGYFQQDEVDSKGYSPLEMPYRVMPPDILSETPYLSKLSVGIQVGDDSDLKTVQGLKDKGEHLNELLKQQMDLCWQLQKQIDEDSVDFVAASVMILSVTHKLQWSQKYCNQLQRKIESTLQKMNVIREKLAEEEANSVKLQEEMMYQRSEHAVAIETLKADYENVMERTTSELKIKHEGEIALAIETHKVQVHEMRQHQEKELAQLKKSHEELIASLKEEHRDEIVELETKHSSAIDELVEEHQVEIETIKSDYDEQQAEFKEKYEKMVNECSALNKKLQQLQDQSEKDTETRIQDAIKKYESLPAELESIKAVLEMKNEEIKQLRKEKMEKHLELENFEGFKSQTKKLQQENESLTFVVETKSRFERQLSVERDTLRDSLERESAKSRRLSLENEELQWRLVNSTSPPGTPTEDQPLSARSNRNSFRLSASFPADTETIDE